MELTLSGARIDLVSGRVHRGERPAEDLSPRELRLIVFLAAHPDRAFDRDALHAGAWGESGEPRAGRSTP